MVCGGDPTFSPSTTAPRRRVGQRTPLPARCGLASTSLAPWGTNYEANLGVIAGDIYYMGGADKNTLNAATADSHVYKSNVSSAQRGHIADSAVD